MDNPVVRFMMVVIVILTIVATASLTTLIVHPGSTGADAGAEISGSAEGGTSLDRKAVEKIVVEMFRNQPEKVLMALEEGRAQMYAKQQEETSVKVVENMDTVLEDESHIVLGNPQGNIAVVEFFDYNCGYCKRMAPVLQQVLKEEGDVKLVLVDFPILGEMSQVLSKVSVAAYMLDKEKFTPLHFKMLQASFRTEEQLLAAATELGYSRAELKAKMESPEVQERLNKNMELARNVGLRGTPAFVVGSEFVPGAIGLDEMRAKIRQAREG